MCVISFLFVSIYLLVFSDGWCNKLVLVLISGVFCNLVILKQIDTHMLVTCNVSDRPDDVTLV